MKLLVVEDDVALRSLVVEHLHAIGFAVDAVGSVDEARAALQLTGYDLMLLDLGLPDGSGQSLLQDARRLTNGALPVVILTARDDLRDRVELLNRGADDFVLKPFDLVELEARLRAVLRRPGARRDRILSHHDLSLDLVSRQASIKGRDLDLSRREAALLEELLRSGGRTVVREALEERLYSFSEPVTPNALEALVSRLRRRLANAHASVEIETKRGIGYKLGSPRLSPSADDAKV